MKVLYILRYFPTLTETFVNQEVSAVQRKGCDVAVAALGQRADGELQDMVPNVPIFEVPRRPLGWQFRTKSRGQQWLAQHQRPKDAARLPGLVDYAKNFEHIHVHFAGEAAEMAHALHIDLGLPYTVMVHAADLFKPRPSMVEVLASATEVLTISEHNQVHLEAQGISARLVRCGPDLTRLRPQPMPKGPLRAIFIGRHTPKKGLDTLLAAWDRLNRPECQLTLVTEKMESAPPAGVTCLGFQPPSKIPQLLADHHVLCLPSQRAPDGDMDGVPVVLMEALAIGRPVLTTPVSGIPELVDHAVGWFHPPGDARALAQSLKDIDADLAGADRKGRNGPQRLVERGYHLQAQVQGVVSAWGRDETSAPGMDADSRTLE